MNQTKDNQLSPFLRYGLMSAAAGLWLFCVKGFLLGDLRLIKDAPSYYDHIKFFIDSLCRGVYPLWDPVWNHGVPNEFFLRRFGSFNPFYSLIVILRTCGVNHFSAYMIFLASYFLLGMFGFYQLARKLMFTELASLSAFLLLLFSTLGTRLFDSFIILVFTPMIWFFVSFINFCQFPKKSSFVAMIFWLMILLTTYIPFYFLTIFACVLIPLILVNVRQIRFYIRSFVDFILSAKTVTFLCMIVLAASLIPGWMMHSSSRSGMTQMPARNTSSASGSNLEVSLQNFGGGGIVTPFMPELFFAHLDDMELERLYIPLVAFLLFLAGLANRLTRTTFVLGIAFVLLFLIGLNDASRIYPWLYRHIFFFKYFRNSLFYLWFGLLPLFILLVCHQFDTWLIKNEDRPFSSMFAVFLPLVLVVYLITLGHVPLWSYLTVAGFILMIMFLLRRPQAIHSMGTIILFALLIVAQPVVIYHALSLTAESEHIPGWYDDDHQSFFKTKTITKPDPSRPHIISNSDNLYYTTPQYYFLHQNLSPELLKYYLSHRIQIYDHLETYSNESDFLPRFVQAVLRDENVAFLNANDQLPPMAELTGRQNGRLNISDTDEHFQLHQYTANTLDFTTHYETPKFLIYNDNFHPDWQAWLDGISTPIYRANHAFKGFLIPAGEHRLRLRFASDGIIWLNRIFLLMFYGMFALWIKWLVTDE